MASNVSIKSQIELGANALDDDNGYLKDAAVDIHPECPCIFGL